MIPSTGAQSKKALKTKTVPGVTKREVHSGFIAQSSQKEAP